MKHTPKPWTVYCSDAQYATFTIEEEAAKETDKRDEANRRLIEMSPELAEFAGLIARMKTEDEFGDNAPASEDYISTLDDLIGLARDLVKKVEDGDGN